MSTAIARTDKRKCEPFAWRMFPNLGARKRCARFAAARYGVDDVYLFASAEWHGELRTRDSVTEGEVFLRVRRAR